MTSSGRAKGANAIEVLKAENDVRNSGINRGSEKDNEIYQYILDELNKYGINWTADNENAV
jgi:hypothetical protein